MSKYSLGTISLNQQAKKYLDQIFATKRVSYGPFCEKLETEFSKLHQCQTGIVCSSGTAALHTILSALKIMHQWPDSTEVIVPATTFVATINAVLLANLKPILVDVNTDDYLINPKLLQATITSKSKVILPVHLFGQPAAMTQIMAIAKKNNLVVVEDCCETVGATYNQKKVGSWGIAGAFSTNSAHVLATGIGGIITTNHKKLGNLMRSLVNHGRDNAYISIDDDKKTTQADFSNIVNSRFLFHYPGFSYRLSEMEAAIGLSQLENLDHIIKKRVDNVRYLNRKLAQLEPYLQLPHIPKYSRNVFMAYPLVLTRQALKNNPQMTEQLIQYLEQHKIETRPLMPILTQPAYQNFNWQRKKFSVANYLLDAGFYVGCHQDLKQADLDYLIQTLTSFFSS